MGAFGKSFNFSGSMQRPAVTTSPLNIVPKVRVGNGARNTPQKAPTGQALRLTGKCPTCR